MKNKNIKLENDEKIVFEENGYTLTEQPDIFDESMSLYVVYDESGNYIGEFSDMKLTDDTKKDFKSTFMYETFLDVIDGFYDDARWYNDDYGSFSALGYYDNYKKEKTPEELEKEKELVESLCKSDTIVFHKDDSSTVMLKPIYEGKGWDVYTGTTYNGLSKESVHELIKRHDKVLCMGHGSPSGLFGGNIGKEEVPLLKNKKLFCLWCYAATFLKDNGIHGVLCSDNCPSEVGECKYVCSADVSAEWIYNNMVYLSKCLRDVIELSFTNPEEACRIAKEKYSKSEATTEDEKKVVEFNTNTLQVS